MYGREELTAYDCNEGSFDSMGFPWQYEEMVYDKDKADKVMDTMEARIKELEEANKLAVIVGNKQAGRIKELEATISKMETTTPKWISVKDRLPEESTFVKVKLESGTKRKMMYAYGNWFDCNEFVWDNDEDKVTNWKPLPPTTEEK